jgi:hypothetical protein
LLWRDGRSSSARARFSPLKISIINGVLIYRRQKAGQDVEPARLTIGSKATRAARNRPLLFWAAISRDWARISEMRPLNFPAAVESGGCCSTRCWRFPHRRCMIAPVRSFHAETRLFRRVYADSLRIRPKHSVKQRRIIRPTPR